MDKTHSTFFKERLYSYMKEQNITLNRVATLSGMAATTLSNIVNRGSAPRIDTIYKICSGLGISVHDFFDFPPYNEVEK
ncbi:helix-turn-helix domain-containing protein [Lactiplantibacillus plantarum]|uniref:helix-turn-helix domain-containing protein n=1 Tax=Lactiplantibacillus plantarum TaxID=1590 RepID=UPI0009B5AB61|nr:helix-turn-helix transcriptional regulator [Lactiplantibacillus plantarum]MDV9114380.1 helix-turn-helix transcriptional regulator [Lactiplantibacillus plantarum]